jgi:hypothetical protein
MKTKAVDRAVPLLTEPSQTSTEKVSSAIVHIASLKNSPDWAAATEVHTAAATWLTENESLDASNKTLADLENKLTKARSHHRAVLRRWDVRKRGVLNAVNATCDGSKDMVQGFGLGVLQRTPMPQATVPEGLRGKRSKTVGTATAVWTTRRGNRGFLVQYATDPANPATFSAPIASSRGKFELTGQLPGATLYVRVLALDPSLPTGQTEYTSWVAVMASS